MRTKLVLAVLAAGAVGAGGALATIPDPGGVIHGCYKLGDAGKSNGAALTVIDSEQGGACKPGYAELAFSQQGPQGPPGPQGPTGPAGPGLGSSTQLVSVHDDPAGNELGWDPPYSELDIAFVDVHLLGNEIALAWALRHVETSIAITDSNIPCAARVFRDQELDDLEVRASRLRIDCPGPVADGTSLAYILVRTT